MLRIPALFVTAFALATPLSAKDNLGVYSNWAAFRDDTPQRCYAIAKPLNASDNGPFASIGTWPRANIRGQVHIRLSRTIRDNGDVTLSLGEREFTLAAHGRNAWARDTQMDAAIVAAMRSATGMSVSARAENGSRFSDRYNLEGAATAMDAAVVGCASG